MAKEKEHDGLRGQVVRYHDQFVGYVKQYGKDAVKQCLMTGRSGKKKIVVSMNRKDRYQMMQLLDMVKEP
jgi:hypothetical protein